MGLPGPRVLVPFILESRPGAPTLPEEPKADWLGQAVLPGEGSHQKPAPSRTEVDTRDQKATDCDLW